MSASHRLLIALVISSMTLMVNTTTASDAPAAKVIGGDNAQPAPPWVAGLHFFSPTQSRFSFRPFCGGSLIAPGWVVSAGHCFVAAGEAGNPANFSPDAADILLRLDSPDLEDTPQHFVRLLRVNPQFGIGSEYDNDIALLQLSSKVAIRPVSLADTEIINRLDNSSELDDVVRILGWGIFDDENFTPGGNDNNFPRFMQSADVDFLPFANNGCRNAWPQMTSNMLCAREVEPDPVSEPFGQDACSGDSGGPLLLPRGSTLSDGDVDQDWLLGATSFGPASCVSTVSPGVFTRLSNYSDWIEQVSASAAANDPLIDIAVNADIADEINPDQALQVPIIISNRSSRNHASDLQLTLQYDNALSLTAPADQGCISNGNGWLCDLPDDLAAGATRQLDFSGNWLGGDNSRADIRVRIDSAQDDYRNNNNEQRQRPLVTRLSDPALTPWLIREQGSGFITLAIRAENRSLANAAENTVLRLSVNHGFTLQSTDPRCSNLEENNNGGQPQCQLGELAPTSNSEVVVTIRGQGNAQIRADLIAANGDSKGGDTVQLRDVSLRSTSSGGGSTAISLMLVLIALAWRQRATHPNLWL